MLRDGLEVALPLRDRGVDLEAYAELGRQVHTFAARPVQMKASSGRAFLVDPKYEKVSGLILAYVWHVADPTQARTYAMEHADAVGVADAMGWTATASWRKGLDISTNPGPKLEALLLPYLMTPGRWWAMIAGGAAVGPPPAIEADAPAEHTAHA